VVAAGSAARKKEPRPGPPLAFPQRCSSGVLTGLVYVVLLFADDQWRRIVPTHWSIVPKTRSPRSAATCNCTSPPSSPAWPYDAAQQLALLRRDLHHRTAADRHRCRDVPRRDRTLPPLHLLFGGKQRARTLHFIGLCLLAGFIVVHTAMVVIHGLPKGLAMIVLGSPSANHTTAVVSARSGSWEWFS